MTKEDNMEKDNAVIAEMEKFIIKVLSENSKRSEDLEILPSVLAEYTKLYGLLL